MPSAAGRRYRSAEAFCYETATCSWWNDYTLENAPKAGRTAHCIVPVGLQDDFRAVGVCAVMFGGNVDADDNSENSLGVPVSEVWLLKIRSLSLKEIVGRFIHASKIPYRVLGTARPRDDLLEELFG
jgi:hypothetical protein